MTGYLPRQAITDAPSGGSRDWRSQRQARRGLGGAARGCSATRAAPALAGATTVGPTSSLSTLAPWMIIRGTGPLYHIYVGPKAPWFTITDSLTQFATAVEQEG